MILSVLSYNIWFDKYKWCERLDKLIEYINLNDIDVICLQEVTNDSLSFIKSRLQNYSYFPDELDCRYGCIIMSKYSFEKTFEFPLKTIMSRKLIAGVINTGHDKILISNCHYESEFNEINMTKVEQYATTLNILNDLATTYGCIIHCADTNITAKESLYYITKDLRWVDCWEEDSGDVDKCFTYDGSTNENLIMRGITHLKSRIDRIVYRGGNNINTDSFDLVKNDISDHYGVICKFAIDDYDNLNL